MGTERARTLRAQLLFELGNLPVDPKYGDNTLNAELPVVDVTGNAEMRIGRAESPGLAVETAPLAQRLKPLFHRVVGDLLPVAETKSGSLYVPSQVNPTYRTLRVTAVGLGSPEVPMPVKAGDLVVVPVEALQTVLGWTVINALDIVGVLVG